MVEGFADDFDSFSLETAKSKLNSGNSKQPNDVTGLKSKTAFTEKNNRLNSSVDIKSVFEENWRPFDLSPGASSQHQCLPKASEDVWPPIASIMLSEDIEAHKQKHWWRVIKKTTADRNKISSRKSAKDRIIKLLTCSSLCSLQS